MPRVLNFGSVNIDHVYQVSHFVGPGETLASDAYARGAGGKGFNQSIALARASGVVVHAGAIGKDGLWLRDRLAFEGASVDKLTVHESLPTGHAIIQVSAGGENAIVLHAGANHAFTPTDIPALFDGLAAGDHLLCQNETSCVAEALAEASARGLVVWFNPAPMTPQVSEYPLDGVDWLVVNETEGRGLSGATSPAEIVTKLHGQFPRACIVLTLGADGVLCREGKTLHRIPAPKVAPIDTTAAGDTFTGYLVAGILAGLPTEEALTRACRAAALCVTRPGAADSVPRADEDPLQD